MAFLTIGRKSRRSVIRIIGLVVIRLVTAVTCIRSVVIVAVVTRGTLIGNGCVRSIQLVIIVVNGECSGLPSGGGVTTCTIRRYGECGVARICALIVIRGMTTRAIGRRAGVPRCMAVDAGSRLVCPCQRKISSVMIERTGGVACRMTGKTGRAVVRISVYSIVFVICLRVGMACRTGKLRKVGGIRMAIGALIPFALVLATIDREILPVVVKSSRRPCRLAVTTGTVHRELSRCMAGIGRLVIIGRVATGTGIRRVVVVAVVTGGALICNGCVRPIQLVIIVVDGECSRLPGGSGVATCTIRRYGKCGVTRICALVVIRGMATRAIGRGAGIPRCMAIDTGSGLVRPRQRKISSVVIEGTGGVACRMAGKTGRAVVRISVDTTMLIIRFGVFMTCYAGKLRIIRWICMAIETLIPFAFVLATVYREIRCIVLRVCRRHPVRVGRVALYAVLGKVGNCMIRIDSRFVIRFMAGNTGCRGTRIISVGMALGAIGNIVSFGKREKVVLYFVGRPVKFGQIVAIGTIG